MTGNTMNETTPDLTSFDFIVVNTSAGKDSQAMMDYVCRLAREAGVLDRVLAVHADLGRVEWKGTRELAEEHAKHYGTPFHVVRRVRHDEIRRVRGGHPVHRVDLLHGGHDGVRFVARPQNLQRDVLRRAGQRLREIGDGVRVSAEERDDPIWQSDLFVRCVPRERGAEQTRRA